MKKIKIKNISKECFTRKGFGVKCSVSSCQDACCRYGADFDKESYEKVYENRQLVEVATGIDLDLCFENEWQGDKDYLGGDCILSKVMPSGYCAFHSPNGKGCVLYQIAEKHGVSRRLIPSICRLYPLTWSDEGELIVYDEDGDDIELDCVCTNPEMMSAQSLFETQKREIDDIISF
ncbi:MAG TPA: hypothetical protein PKY78_08595 [Candidatus Omnitrophota bacterium]|nr:hypothetical protein [Candidatus Omnitrophota bacterium]